MKKERKGRRRETGAVRELNIFIAWERKMERGENSHEGSLRAAKRKMMRMRGGEEGGEKIHSLSHARTRMCEREGERKWEETERGKERGGWKKFSSILSCTREGESERKRGRSREKTIPLMRAFMHTRENEWEGEEERGNNLLSLAWCSCSTITRREKRKSGRGEREGR